MSVVDLTLCDSCDGMYEPCDDHEVYPRDRGYFWYSVRDGDMAAKRRDISADMGDYQISDHAQLRMGQRSIGKSQIADCIRYGEVSNTYRNLRYKLHYGGVVVVVHLQPDIIRKRDHFIVTTYKSDTRTRTEKIQKEIGLEDERLAA